MHIRLARVIILPIILIIIYGVNAFGDSQVSLKIQIKIVQNASLKAKLENLAREIEKTAALYQTSDQRDYCGTEGKKSFVLLLHSEGYYSAIIDIELPTQNSNSIIFHIDAQQRYKLEDIHIQHAKESNASVILPDINNLGIHSGQYASTKDLTAVQKKILEIIEQENCLLTIAVSHTAMINHFDDTINITYIVDAGPRASIEKVNYQGLKGVKEEYVHKIVRLKNGQCFKNSYINDARIRLQKSALFSLADATIPNTTNKNGSVPITFNLTERKFRSIKTGVSYGTDLGPGATLGWEHHNYFGGGEDLNINFFLNQKEQVVELNYVEQYYKRPDQKLILGSKFENKKSKAFDHIEHSIFGFLERELTPKWSGGVGSKLSKAKVKRDGETQNFSLLSIPIYLKLDTRKNILNPKKGHAIRMEVAPFFSVRSQDKLFLKSQISGSKYFSVKTKLSPTLAIHCAYGTILGTGSIKLPINEKFYVGGAQSLRGYEYQFAGELDSKKRPLGGRSFITTSLELRLNLTDIIGIVGFLDSGRSYSTITPNLKQPFMHGAGFGLRYMTVLGPIRADIGFPLKRRKFIDKTFQLYFGIGQAF